MRTSLFKTAFAISLMALWLLSSPVQSVEIEGVVTGENLEPIFGASVRIYRADSSLAQTMTDTLGRFEVHCPATAGSLGYLTVSAIGYRSKSIAVDASLTKINSQFILKSQAVELPALKVSGTKQMPLAINSTGEKEIDRRTGQALLSTDPVKAVREASVQHVGSIHSSKIRVHGSSPQFYLNSQPIGNDPNHYGVFSFIPSPALSHVAFYTGATSARYGTPTLIDLSTPNRFVREESGELNLSVVDATATVTIASKRAFTVATLRKSVLDKLVDKIEYTAARATLPPTNFQDILISSGVNLSPAYRLYIDQYHVRDFLALNTARIRSIRSYNTFQNMQDNYLSTRLERLTNRSLVRLSGSLKFSHEIYRASPPDSLHVDDLYIDLNSRQRDWRMALDGDFDTKNGRVAMGIDIDATGARKVDMFQQNWNFLPPDASSDLPFVYQDDLNTKYGEFHETCDRLHLSAYGSLERDFDNWSAESGLRLEHFKYLADPTALLLRQRVQYTFDESRSLQLFAGSFAESPINRMLEPYQVIILDQQSSLTPIKTTLLSASLTAGNTKLTLFRKFIRNRPIHSPLFDSNNDLAEQVDDRLRFGSEGELDLTGGSIRFQTKRLLESDINLYSYYAYTDAAEKLGDLTVDYELNARHRLYGELEYPLTSRWTIGCDASVHSGLSFTQSDPLPAVAATDTHSRRYFSEFSSTINSQRFPANYSLNLHGRYDFGSGEIFFNIANATNRANPIIATANDFVYDAGILPSVGLRLKF